MDETDGTLVYSREGLAGLEAVGDRTNCLS